MFKILVLFDTFSDVLDFFNIYVLVLKNFILFCIFQDILLICQSSTIVVHHIHMCTYLFYVHMILDMQKLNNQQILFSLGCDIGRKILLLTFFKEQKRECNAQSYLSKITPSQNIADIILQMLMPLVFCINLR